MVKEEVLKKYMMDDDEKDSSKKTVSYSQISMYHQCQYKWYLTYVEKKGKSEDNIYLIFGSSIHTVLQKYLNSVYNGTVSEADSMDLEKLLFDELKLEFKKSFEKNGTFPASKDEMSEFLQDGFEILRWFKKHRGDYFSKKGYKLLGCEIPIIINLKNNLQFIAYIDIVLQDIIGNRILIKDFKTSTRGWNEYQKKDESKIQQMVLYKKFYSEKYGIPLDNIDIEYIILKRKLNENSYYPQKRIQTFSPASGTVTTSKVINNLNLFINECFTEEGEYNFNRTYFKNANDKNCKYCEFSNNKSICDKLNK